MYVRVVRFSGVSTQRLDELLERVKDAGGPPPGIESSGLKILVDAAQSTAVVLQEFATAEDMDAAAKIFDAMDSADTPGTRTSVDACELKLALTA